MSSEIKNRFGRPSWWSRQAKNHSWLSSVQRKLAGTAEKNVPSSMGARVRKSDLGS